MFSKRQFLNPPAERTPAYFWGINAEMKPRELIAQLHEMFRQGARSVCLHPLPSEFRPDLPTTMSPPYLSEEYHRIVAVLVDECARIGMNYYLYDEGGWPSGSACGKVLASDPERFAMQFVVPDEAKGWRIVKEKGTPGAGAVRPGITERGAVEKFMELTHEGYAKHLNRHFGSTIKIVFTDEPYMPSPGPLRDWGMGPGTLGWCEDFAEEFLKRKGYDIRPHLAELMRTRSQAINPLANIRIDYYDVLSHLMVERYLLPIRRWCRARGLKSGGHLGGEDEWTNFHCTGFGHVLRSLRALDVPGVDMVWRQLFPGMRLHPFPKLASSAAHQIGGREVIGEMFAVYGNGLSPAEMKYLIDYMLVCGVNTFIFSGIPQSAGGAGMKSGTRPGFGPTDSLWKYFRTLHDYAARMGVLMTGGRSVINTAVYFDMRSMWLGGRPAEYAINRNLELSSRLLERQCNFDYIDDDIIREGKLYRGRLIAGDSAYRTVIIPDGSLLEESARDRLAELKAAGVKVVSPEEVELAAPLLTFTPATWRLRVSKVKFGDGQAGYFVFNTSKTAVSGRISIPESGPVSLAVPETGEFFTVSEGREWEWTFEPWGSAFFITKVTGEPLRRPGRILKTLGSWELSPLRSYAIGKNAPVIAPCPENFTKVRPGDWRKVLGDWFSGDAVYRTVFRWRGDVANGAFLDLGDVRYACEVRLNGQPLGKRIWRPFRFDLTGALQRGDNLLEVVVSNTRANSLADPAALEGWNLDSFYEAVQRTFESSALPSGLFGPVVIREKLPQKQSETAK